MNIYVYIYNCERYSIEMEPIDLISRSYTFDITDGRIIQGILIAIDDQSNLLVTNATESKDNHYRELGLVSIRRNTIKKVSVSLKDYNQTFAKHHIV